MKLAQFRGHYLRAFEAEGEAMVISRKKREAQRQFEAEIRREFIRSAENWHGENWGRNAGLTHAQIQARAELGWQIRQEKRRGS